jgi:hypothetical protein
MPAITLHSEGVETQQADSHSQEPQQSQRQPPNMSSTNLKTNDTFGHKLQLPKPITSRFVSLNINGFRWANAFEDALETVQCLKVTSADIWKFQETNTNWQLACLSKCYEKFCKVFHHVRMATSSSIVTYRTLYQPGGPMSAVTDDYIGRFRETGSDTEMGRWSFMQILVDQVCNQNANTVGDGTAFAQQLSLLCQNDKDCSPQKSFLSRQLRQTAGRVDK